MRFHFVLFRMLHVVEQRFITTKAIAEGNLVCFRFCISRKACQRLRSKPQFIVNGSRELQKRVMNRGNLPKLCVSAETRKFKTRFHESLVSAIVSIETSLLECDTFYRIISKAFFKLAVTVDPLTSLTSNVKELKKEIYVVLPPWAHRVIGKQVSVVEFIIKWMIKHYY